MPDTGVNGDGRTRRVKGTGERRGKDQRGGERRETPEGQKERERGGKRKTEPEKQPDTRTIKKVADRKSGVGGSES